MPQQDFIPGLGIPSATLYSALGIQMPQPEPDMANGGLNDAVSHDASLDQSGPPATSDLVSHSLSGPPAALANLGSSGSVRGSVEAGGTAYNPVTADAIDARAKRPGGINGTLQDIHNQQTAVLGNAEKAAETSADEQKAAQAGVGKAEQDKIIAEGQQNHALAQMNQGYADEEAKQDALVQSKLTQAASDYAASMADFRAAKVNPGGLWSNMSGGEKFGMLASAFAHDYLGSRGIHTSVMDTFNRAVDQNINAQVENIKNKRDAAEGFKSLFDMTTAQSRTESEAKLRMRGYLLTSFQDQVASEMAGYDSNLAGAKSQQAMAAIDTELVKNKAELAKVWNSNANSERDAAMQKYGDDQRASMEIAKAKIEAGARAGAAQQEHIDKKSATAVNDPETGKTLGHANEAGAAKEVQTKINDVYSMYKEANEQMSELGQLGKHYQGPLASKLQGATANAVDALRQHIAISFDRATGGARAVSTAAILDKFDQLFPKAGFTSNESLQKAIGTMSTVMQAARAGAVTDVATLQHDPLDETGQFAGTPNEVRPIGPNAGATGRYGAAEGTVLNANAKNKGENPTDNEPLTQIAKTVQGESGTDRVGYSKDEAHAQEYLGYLSQHKDEIQSGDKGTKYDRIDLNDSQNHGGTEVPTWGDALMKLQDIATPNAKSPNALIQGFPDQYTPEERQQARDMLVKFASGGADAGDGVSAMSGDQMLFAQYLLGDLVHREQGLQ